MLKYVAKRILLTILTLWILFTIMFIICRLFPDKNLYWIYNDPLPVQYFNSLKAIITRFDWGTCTTAGPLYMNVTRYCAGKIAFTLYTSGVAFVLSITLAFFLGIFCAYFDNGPLGTLVNICALGLGSLPCFVVGYALQYIAFRTGGIIPLVMDIGYEFLSIDMLKSVILPIIALTLGPTALYMQHLRNDILETYNSDFVALLKIKGLTKWQIYKKHLIQHATISVLTQIPMSLTVFTVNAFIIEKMFAIPGAGMSFIRCFFYIDHLPEDVSWLHTLGIMTDYNVFVMYSMFFISIVICGGLLIDIIYGLLDPRIRVGTNKANIY